MVEVTVRHLETGKRVQFVAETAVVILSDGGDIALCSSGEDEDNLPALSGMLRDAHAYVAESSMSESPYSLN